MKKEQRDRQTLHYLGKQLPRLKREAAATKSGKLWRLEAVLRNKLKDLRKTPPGQGGYKQIYEGYVALLDEVSERLLEHYNKVNKTDYRFSEIIKGNYGAYLSSGIISVLVTGHIPKIIAGEFSRLLSENPKDDYPEARGLKRKFYLHLGDTNTGKTYNAMKRLMQSENGIYLAPLRILALENFERMNAEGIRCSLLTGEEEILVEGALHSSRTVEKADLKSRFEVAVIDEVQLLSDQQRGDAWTRAILGVLSPEIHLCGAKNVKDQLIRMINDCGDEFEVIEYTRNTPLQIQKAIVRQGNVSRGDALIAFSKRGVLRMSRYYSELGIKNSVIYGDLPPEVRRLQYNAFINGENSILISTDAIGMGINLPIKRIIFTEVKKFDGGEFRFLTSQEVKQIAGRAGRIGIYDVGYVASMSGEINYIEEMLETEDTAVDKAVVGPVEAILKIGGLPLKEKLALWGAREEAIPFYRKKDVRDYILVLEALRHYRLPEAVEWRLMLLPFDVNSESILGQFILYVEECFRLKAEDLSRPEIGLPGLAAYEEYYQKVNLYYSFSKSMNLPFDEEWVYRERKKISGEINRLL